MSTNDLKTHGLILQRTNYGEADRILNFLTPEGRISCVAKGVRKEKSKLAGSIELFTVSELTVHFKKPLENSPDDNLGVLTSAKIKKFYSNILKDFDRLDLASRIIKDSNRLANSVDSPDLFDLLNQCLWGLDATLADITSPASSKIDETPAKTSRFVASPSLVESFFLLNSTKISGTEINLLFDRNGEKLKSGQDYYWDSTEECLVPLVETAYAGKTQGIITTDHIKLLRLILSAKLNLVARVKNAENLLPEISYIAKTVAKK